MPTNLVALLIVIGLGLLGGLVRYLLMLSHHDKPVCARDLVIHQTLGTCAAMTVGVISTLGGMQGAAQQIIVAIACLSSTELLTWGPRGWHIITRLSV